MTPLTPARREALRIVRDRPLLSAADFARVWGDVGRDNLDQELQILRSLCWRGLVERECSPVNGIRFQITPAGLKALEGP